MTSASDLTVTFKEPPSHLRPLTEPFLLCCVEMLYYVYHSHNLYCVSIPLHTYLEKNTR